MNPTIKFSLSTSTEGEGSVTQKVIKTGSATDYTIGSVIELTATPTAEWLFVEWKGDVTGTENPVEITIDARKFNDQDYLFIQNISEILDDSGAEGQFELGNLFINIKKYKTYTKDLIQVYTKDFNYQYNLQKL